MKKTLLLAAMMMGIGLFSCKKEVTGPTIYPDGTMDVVFNGSRNTFTDAEGNGTRLEVYPRGGTTWTPGDKAILVDWDEGRSGRVFSYVPKTSNFSGAFSGRLLAGQGVKTYYAYHMPDEADGSLATSMVLYIRRGHDINIVENGQKLEWVFGRHCAMVAIPRMLDVENISPGDRGFQFHHVNSMIEARIGSLHENDMRLNDLLFDKVVFTFTAGEGQVPFSTEVQIDMTQIVNGGANTSIPFTEFESTKIPEMFTLIDFDNIHRLGDYMVDTDKYCIPIFALPTTTVFDATARIDFSLNDVPVATLSKSSRTPADGLRLSGLNPIDFDESDLTFYEPYDPTGNTGGDDYSDDDDDDQGEDNNDD
jgi:hypothetical protein